MAKSCGNEANAAAEPLLLLPPLLPPLLELLLEPPLLELLPPPPELLPEPPWPLVQAIVPQARAQKAKASVTRQRKLSDDMSIP